MPANSNQDIYGEINNVIKFLHAYRKEVGVVVLKGAGPVAYAVLDDFVKKIEALKENPVFALTMDQREDWIKEEKERCLKLKGLTKLENDRIEAKLYAFDTFSEIIRWAESRKKLEGMNGAGIEMISTLIERVKKLGDLLEDEEKLKEPALNEVSLSLPSNRP